MRHSAEGQAPRPGRAGNAEINELDIVFGIYHDVFRLQVTEYDLVLMDVLQRMADAKRNLYRALGGKLLPHVRTFAHQLSLSHSHYLVNPPLTSFSHPLYTKTMLSY